MNNAYKVSIAFFVYYTYQINNTEFHTVHIQPDTPYLSIMFR
jgi:hypothetical protein